MKRFHSKNKKEKEVLQLIKRRDELFKLIRNLGYIELDKPIRHGWYLVFKINHKVERYKNQKYIEEVYQKLDFHVWGRTKEEAQKNWDTKRNHHWIYNDIPTLSPKQYRKLSDPAKRLCAKFLFKCNKRWYHRYYIKLPHNIVEVKFEKAYITHRKRIEPKLESESDYIDSLLESSKYYRTYQKICFIKWSWKDGLEYRYIRTKEKRNWKNEANLSKDEKLKQWERN